MKDSADTSQCAFNQILWNPLFLLSRELKENNSYEIAPNVVVGEILDN